MRKTAKRKRIKKKRVAAARKREATESRKARARRILTKAAKVRRETKRERRDFLRQHSPRQAFPVSVFEDRNIQTNPFADYMRGVLQMVSRPLQF